MDWTTEYALCSYGWLFLSACLGPARSKNAVLFDRSSSPSTFYIYYDVLCIAVWASERSSTTTAGGVASAPHVYIYCIVFSTRQCRCIYTHSFLFLPSSLYFSLFFLCFFSLFKRMHAFASLRVFLRCFVDAMLTTICSGKTNQKLLYGRGRFLRIDALCEGNKNKTMFFPQ